MKEFCHLHLHSEYSMLDGLCRLDELLTEAERKGMKALAITDHHNVSGVVEFYQKAQKYGIKPIIGTELDVGSVRLANGRDQYHLTLLVKNHQGYINLMTMLTRSNLKGQGIVNHALLESCKQGVIVLSGCKESELDYWIQNDYQKAKEVALAYRNLFGQNNYYIELQRFGVHSEEKIIQSKVRLAKELNIPLIATNNVHYLKRKDQSVHLALNGIQQLSGLESYQRKENNEYYLKSAEEMEQLFQDLPEALENTNRVAARCNLYLDLDQLYYPQFPVPDGFTRESYLKYLCNKGLQARYEKPGVETLKRLEYELGVINRMGYAGYFLIIWDIVQYGRQQGILTAGRGSAVSSLVCYLLQITTVDPLEYELYFERFLNPERTSMPDIDLDIDHVGRKKILRYIAEKYGEENMAHLSAFSTMAARAVVRDVARVQGWPEKKLTPLTRFISHQNIQEVDSVINSAEFKETYYRNAAFRKLINTAQMLEGLPRHFTQHSAGVVISPDSLTNYTALQYARDGEVITQFDMRTVEKLGLLKIDLLGVRFLSAIRFALKMLKQTKGINLSVEQIPLDDSQTYQLIQRGDTIGCFQLESGGCRKLLQQLRPASLKEIMFATSLYRPGPLEGGMVQSFVARLHKEEEVEYLHPFLEDLLKDTYGVILFQEQVMLTARELAGFSLGEADVLRKAIGKRDPFLLAQQKNKFIQGAKERGLSTSEANYIFDKLHKFSGYGFCKAHAAAYAHIAYLTAYLKTHYPVEYITALFNVNMGFDCRIRQYLNQARFRKIKILPPDVNCSQLLAATDGEKIQMGFLMIKGLGKKAADEVIQKRQGVSYRSLSDFCHRVDLGLVNCSMLENMIKAGAFDGLGPRLSQLWGAPKIFNEVKEHKVISDQLRCLPHQNRIQVFTQAVPDMELVDILKWELESMGHPISGNPLTSLLADQRNIVLVADLEEKEEGIFWIAGEITAMRFRWTRRANLVSFFTLEDPTGTAEVTVFEPVVSKRKKLLYSGNIVLVKVKLEKEGKIYNLFAEEIQDYQEEK